MLNSYFNLIPFKLNKLPDVLTKINTWKQNPQVACWVDKRMTVVSYQN